MCTVFYGRPACSMNLEIIHIVYDYTFWGDVDSHTGERKHTCEKVQICNDQENM